MATVVILLVAVRYLIRVQHEASQIHETALCGCVRLQAHSVSVSSSTPSHEVARGVERSVQPDWWRRRRKEEEGHRCVEAMLSIGLNDRLCACNAQQKNSHAVHKGGANADRVLASVRMHTA